MSSLGQKTLDPFLGQEVVILPPEGFQTFRKSRLATRVRRAATTELHLVLPGTGGDRTRLEQAAPLPAARASSGGQVLEQHRKGFVMAKRGLHVGKTGRIAPKSAPQELPERCSVATDRPIMKRHTPATRKAAGRRLPPFLVQKVL